MMLGWNPQEAAYDDVGDDEQEKEDDGTDEYGICTLGSSCVNGKVNELKKERIVLVKINDLRRRKWRFTLAKVEG